MSSRTPPGGTERSGDRSPGSGGAEPRTLAAALLLVLALGSLYLASRGTPVEEVRLLPCPFRLLTGLACPGCGMTRACLHLARGDASSAWERHPFAFPLLGAAVALALAPRRATDAWRRAPPALRRLALGAALGALLGLWVARLALR